MSKETLNSLISLTNQTSAVNTVNSNNAVIVSAFDNTVSRDGTAPNQMLANFDMNSNRILNLVNAVSTSEPVTLAQMNAALVANGNINTGLTGVPVSAAMQPVVNASTISAANALLGLSIPYIDASLPPYNVVGDGVTDNAAGLQAAITAAAGQLVLLPAGTIVLKSQVHWITSTLFAPGLRLSGRGVNITKIDNQVINNSCIYTAGSISNFQLGGYIGNFTITSTTSPSGSHGIEHFAVYQTVIENVWVENMTGDGMRITANLGDSDASNCVWYRNCRFTNCLNGMNCNFFTSAVQTSFVRFDQCFFDTCGIGVRWSGAYGMIIGGGFVTCTTAALNIYNNSTSNDVFQCFGVSFENNAIAIKSDNLQGGSFIGCEFAAGSAGTPVCSTANVLTNTTGVRFIDSRIRISSTPNVLWTFGSNATGNVIDNSFYQNYDNAGQTRYSVGGTAFSNRIDLGFDNIAMGLSNGISNITCVNGGNENVVLPTTGAAYSLAGPTSGFNIGGFTNGFDGRRLTITNNTGQVLTLNAEDVNSTAANRINTDNNSNVTINNKGSFVLIYNFQAQRWFLVGKG